MRRRNLCGLLLMSLLVLCTGPDRDNYSATWDLLDNVRSTKKTLLSRYLAVLAATSHAIRSDSLMNTFFSLKRTYYQLSKTEPPPAVLVKNMEKLKGSIQQHYLRNYLHFYDILFIDRNGDVFFTVRKQADYHKNVFEEPLENTVLAQRLRSLPRRQSFVDYSYYAISGEPSAFFIEPVIHGGELMGWFVLQAAVNKINTMFAYDEQLGATGEVILVNRRQAMLTDSRFSPASTILRQYLSPRNVDAKFREREGHKIVTDYRGYRVITSFEVVAVPEGEWLLVAKIDEDEIVTGFYRRHRRTLQPQLLQCIEAAGTGGSAVDSAALRFPENFAGVDMDEFRRVDSGQILGTRGVSTCTVLIISLRGRFAYMAHISPYDRMYGGTQTDLVGHMVQRIYHLDLCPREKRELDCYVVAPDTKSFAAVFDGLVEKGILLSQIRAVCQKSARYVNVCHDYHTGNTLAEWIPKEEAADPRITSVSECRTVGELVRIKRFR